MAECGSGYCPNACTWPHDHRFERDGIPWPARTPHTAPTPERGDVSSEPIAEVDPTAGERCPTPCDADCDIACHEGHQPKHKWAHDAHECIQRQCAAEPDADTAAAMRRRGDFDADGLVSAEPDAGDAEALARVLEDHGVSPMSRARGVAESILASDWLAADRAATAERALDALIDQMCDCGDFDGHPGDCAATPVINLRAAVEGGRP